MVHNTKSLIGSGIWPFYLATPVAANTSIVLNTTCPVCKKSTGKVIPALARNFLSILFIPLFPLDLTNVIWCKSCNRFVQLTLSAKNKKLIWDQVNTKNYKSYDLGNMGSWGLPASLALIGSGIGWFLFPMLLITIPKYILAPLIFGFLGYQILGKILDAVGNWNGNNAYWVSMLIGGLIGMGLSFTPLFILGFPVSNIMGVFIGIVTSISLFFLGSIYNPYQFNC